MRRYFKAALLSAASTLVNAQTNRSRRCRASHETSPQDESQMTHLLIPFALKVLAAWGPTVIVTKNAEDPHRTTRI
jgi:hypothetical protein